MTTEWDDTPWAGIPVERSLVVQPDMAMVKAVTGPFAANVSYGTYLDRSQKTPQARMRVAQAAFHHNPWVGTAETVVTRKVTGLAWHLEDENDEDYEAPYPPNVEAAYDLLEKPQAALPPEMRDPGLLTRRSLINLTSRHMGLCNVAYWYLDQADQNGIPLALLYVNPARVWPVCTANGRIVGWVLDPTDEYGHGGTPLELADLLPFYLNPPDWGPYGSGLYERVALKAQITTLADQHAAYVLGTGGRLAGIVSPKTGTLSEEQYATLVREFRQVNEAPDAAKRTTILKGPTDFTQTGGDPESLALLDLSRMNRDDILAVWGVPPSQAGITVGTGLNGGLTKGFDEAVLMQGAVHDRVVAIRETIQYGLLDRWLKIGTTIDLEIEEPEFDDKAPLFELAAKAINVPLTNAERRDLVGFAPFGDARDDEVWLPALQQSAYTTTNGPQMPATPSGTAMMVKASKREFLGLRRTVDTRWVPSVRKTVAGLLAAQRAEIAAKVRAASPATIARQRNNPQAFFDRGTEAERLRKLLAPVLGTIAQTVSARTTAMLKPEGKADPFSASVVSSLLEKVGARIVGITGTTQDAVSAAIAQGYADGLSPSQIGDLIENLPAFDEARAELVARTETMFAYNDAALSSYAEFGVSEVEAIDGDEDEECATRDGQTFSIEEAANIEDHPNGTLDWLPVLGKAETMRPDLTPIVSALMATVVDNDARAKAALAAQGDQSAEMMARLVAFVEALAAKPAAQISVNVPEQAAPIVNVAAPEVVVPPTVVNVAAPIVNVAPSEVKVLMPPDQAKKITYDRNGRISGVEPV